MKKCMLLLVLSSWLNLTAYNQDFISYNFFIQELNSRGESFKETKSYSEIQGTPYMNDDFQDGLVITKDDKSINIKLRFNIYTNEIEFMNNNKVFSIANPTSIKEFCIGEQKIQYCTYNEGGKIKNGFLMVMVQGPYSLYLKKKVEFQAKEKAEPYKMPKPDRFLQGKDSYFISAKNGSIQKVSSLKKFYNLFPEIKHIASNYPSSTVDFNSEVELIKFVNFINQNFTKK